MEDSVDGEKKELQEKIESLESIVRMIELKAKNSADHGKLFINDDITEDSCQSHSLFVRKKICN